MKFLTLFALAGVFTSALAAPAPELALEKRLGPADEPKAIARVTTLYNNIKQYTAVISTGPIPIFLPFPLPASPPHQPTNPSKSSN